MTDGHDIAMALRRAYLTMHREADGVRRSIGLTANQFVVLWALSREDQLTQIALADRIASDRNTIRPILMSLERQKLITRSPHPTDRRALRVKRTKAGREKFVQARRASNLFRRNLATPFSNEELRLLVGLLSRIPQVTPPSEAEESIESYAPR